MALDAAKIAVEHREVLLRDKPQAMLDASPKGTVPVLVLPDGKVVDESLDIMEWSLTQHDPDGWLDTQTEDRQAAEAFLDAFKDRLDRYKYASRYNSDAKRGDVDLDKRAEAMAVLTAFTAPLADTPFLRGERAQLIDIATFPFVRQFAAVERDWWSDTAPDGLKNWLDHHLNSPRFKRIMKKFPLWQENKA
jgi:glutathione S-transferase